MTKRMRRGRILGAAVALASGALLLQAPSAEAAARGAHGGRLFVRGPFLGAYAGPYFRPYFGLGFGPYFGPYWSGFYPGYDYGPGPYYGPPGGVDMTVAMMTGWGALDLNVKPNRADVWVDGEYRGEARNFDGYPSYLWLEKGPHRIAIYKGGYKTFDEPVEVQRGVRKELKVRLVPGDSPPPGTKPSDKPKQTKDS